MKTINNKTMVVNEFDTLVQKALIKDKIFYLWFDKECGDKNKSYGGDIIYKDSQKEISFEVSLVQGVAELKTEIKVNNRFWNVTRTRQKMSIDKLESMALYEIIEIINKDIALISF